MNSLKSNEISAERVARRRRRVSLPVITLAPRTRLPGCDRYDSSERPANLRRLRRAAQRVASISAPRRVIVIVIHPLAPSARPAVISSRRKATPRYWGHQTDVEASIDARNAEFSLSKAAARDSAAASGELWPDGGAISRAIRAADE